MLTTPPDAPAEDDVVPAAGAPASGLWARILSLRHLTFLRLGMAGQVLTLISMVIPILLRDGDAVTVLVYTSAVATFLCQAALLGYPFVFPVIRGARTAREATRVSLAALALVALALLPLTLLEPALHLHRGTFATAAFMLATFGFFTITMTRMVRANDATGIGLIRIYYGGAVLATTVIASTAPLGPLALSLGTSIAYLLAALVMTRRLGRAAVPMHPPSRRARRRLRRAYLGRALRPTTAVLFNGWTTFVPGLALPGLGAAAAPWAIVSRICGGFSTILISIIGPALEARMSGAIRIRDRAEFTTARRTALLINGSVAVLAVVSGLALAIYTGGPGIDHLLLPLAVATALYWGGLLGVQMINRVPNFLGRDTARLAWDVSRAVLITAVFVTVHGVTQLIAMGALITASGVLLLPMSRWQVRDSDDSAATPDHPSERPALPRPSGAAARTVALFAGVTLLGAGAFAAVGAGYERGHPRTYTSEALVAVLASPDPTVDVPIDVTDLWVNLGRSEFLRLQVAARLRVAPDTLAADTTVTEAGTSAALVSVTAATPDATQASRWANGLADQLVARSVSAPIRGSTLRRVSTAMPAPTPSGPSPALIVLGAAVVGSVVGGSAARWIHRRRRTR